MLAQGPTIRPLVLTTLLKHKSEHVFFAVIGCKAQGREALIVLFFCQMKTVLQAFVQQVLVHVFVFPQHSYVHGCISVRIPRQHVGTLLDPKKTKRAGKKNTRVQFLLGLRHRNLGNEQLGDSGVIGCSSKAERILAVIAGMSQ